MSTAQLRRLLPPVVLPQSEPRYQESSQSMTWTLRGMAYSGTHAMKWMVRLNGLMVNAQQLKLPDGRVALQVKPVQVGDVVQVFAANANGYSMARSAVLNVTPSDPDASTEGRSSRGVLDGPDKGPPDERRLRLPSGRILVLGVGVSSYRSASIQSLRYSDKDVTDFARMWHAQQGRGYTHVQVKTLLNEQASKTQILAALGSLASEAKATDTIIIMLAGHGLYTPKGGYVFLPHDVDLSRPLGSGLSSQELMAFAASLTVRRVLFLDTCHSGSALTRWGSGVLENRDVVGLVEALSAPEYNFVVFSSSTGRQQSFEDDKWGNGAFTKALLEGLGGQARWRDMPYISHKMLDLYVSQRVTELTEGRQTPVTQAPGGVPDFALVVLPKP